MDMIIKPRSCLSKYRINADGIATHRRCAGCTHFRPLYWFLKGTKIRKALLIGQCVGCRFDFAGFKRFLNRLYERKFCVECKTHKAKCFFTVKGSRGYCSSCKERVTRERTLNARREYELRRKMATEPRYDWAVVGKCECSKDDVVEIKLDKRDGTYYSVLMHAKDLPIIYGETLNTCGLNRTYVNIKRPWDTTDDTVNGYLYETIKLHRRIYFGLAEKNQPLTIDHINNNALDNRRCNLRVATHQQNSWNRPPNKRVCSSKYKGVSRMKQAKARPWLARLVIDGKAVLSKSFATELEAARAHDVAARKHHGVFAYLNFQTGKTQ